jgi:4'-phosphopantetheinyl transferase
MEANVWAVPLHDPPFAREHLHSLLTTRERERASRFRRADDRGRAIIGRGMLRILLGGWTGRPPDEIELVESPRGRPLLHGEGRTILHFNVAHSGDWIMIGVAEGARVGVDVEQIRPVADMANLMARFFAPGEAAAITSLRGSEQVTAFFDCWTRKEAYVKALGDGLQFGLDRFEVECGPGRAPAILSIDGSTGEASRWRLWCGSPAVDYRAAVATECAEVRPWLWSGREPPSAWVPSHGHAKERGIPPWPTLLPGGIVL